MGAENDPFDFNNTNDNKSCALLAMLWNNFLLWILKLLQTTSPINNVNHLLVKLSSLQSILRQRSFIPRVVSSSYTFKTTLCNWSEKTAHLFPISGHRYLCQLPNGTFSIVQTSLSASFSPIFRSILMGRPIKFYSLYRCNTLHIPLTTEYRFT